nr:MULTISPECIES: NAD(P)-binding domain-containing protein [unclassified Rhodococcus (in: high G+C Gram-positive bacteria)]
MHMTTVGILGAGYVGETLARRLAQVGYTVKIANTRGPESLGRLDAVADVEPVWATTVFENADIAILAIPQTQSANLGPEVSSALGLVPTVIDTGNYGSDRDGNVADILNGLPATQWLADRLDRVLYKTLNNIEAHWMADGGRPVGDPDRIALPVSGPAGPGLETVKRLVDDLGFDPFHYGDIDESWRQQMGTRTYCTNSSLTALRTALAGATLDQTLEPNQVAYFVEGRLDHVAVMRNQAIKLKEKFGSSFGDPRINARRENP